MLAVGMVPFDGHFQAGSAFHSQIKHLVSSSREVTDVNGSLQQNNNNNTKQNKKTNQKSTAMLSSAL